MEWLKRLGRWIVSLFDSVGTCDMCHEFSFDLHLSRNLYATGRWCKECRSSNEGQD